MNTDKFYSGPNDARVSYFQPVDKTFCIQSEFSVFNSETGYLPCLWTDYGMLTLSHSKGGGSNRILVDDFISQFNVQYRYTLTKTKVLMEA